MALFKSRFGVARVAALIAIGVLLPVIGPARTEAQAQSSSTPDKTAGAQATGSEQTVPAANASPRLLPRPAEAADKVRRITVDVQVRDSAGRPVPGLKLEDFWVRDNGQPVENLKLGAAEKESGSEPTEIVFMIDAVSSNFEEIARTKQQIQRLLEKNGGQLAHPVSIVWLAMGPVKNASRAPVSADAKTLARPVDSKQASLRVILASKDGQALSRELGKSEIVPSGILEAQGRQGNEQRARLSLQALDIVASAEMDRPGGKVVIWISPGWPLLLQSDQCSRDELFDFVVYLNTQLGRARMTLFAVDPLGVTGAINEFQSSYSAMGMGAESPQSGIRGYSPQTSGSASGQAGSYSSSAKAPRSVKQVEPEDVALPVLALQSGGRALSQSNDLGAELAASVAVADTFYTLSYDAPTAKKPNEYHAMDVRVARHGLSVKNRAGYYAQPVAGAR
jgi:VWFA-related protein